MSEECKSLESPRDRAVRCLRMYESGEYSVAQIGVAEKVRPQRARQIVNAGDIHLQREDPEGRQAFVENLRSWPPERIRSLIFQLALGNRKYFAIRHLGTNEITIKMWVAGVSKPSMKFCIRLLALENHKGFPSDIPFPAGSEEQA